MPATNGTKSFFLHKVLNKKILADLSLEDFRIFTKLIIDLIKTAPVQRRGKNRGLT